MSVTALKELKNLNPLSFTREGTEATTESDAGFILLDDSGGYQGYLVLEDGQHLPTGVNPTRAVPIQNGADPKEVARWIENHDDLLVGFCTGEVPLWQIKLSLSNGVRAWHWIDDGSWIREDFEGWVDRGCPGNLLDFLLRRRGAAAKIADEKGEQFLRCKEEECSCVFYAWIPLSVIDVMEKVGRESGYPTGVWTLGRGC